MGVGLVQFKPEKCEVLRITRKGNPLNFPHTLHNKELNSTDATKYQQGSKLVFSHTGIIKTTKVNNSLRFTKRNIKTSNKQVKENAYNTMFELNSNTVLPSGIPSKDLSSSN